MLLLDFTALLRLSYPQNIIPSLLTHGQSDAFLAKCFAEQLYSKEVTVRVSKLDIDQLSKIFDVLGTPLESSLSRLCTSRVLKYIKTWPRKQKANFRVIFPKGDSQALDLLDKLLAFDPDTRITASESLRHPYLSSYHIPDDEPEHDRLFDFSFESAATIDQIKNIIAIEVADFARRGASAPAETNSAKRPE